MKITLAYIPEEEREAEAAANALHRRYPGSKIRKSDRHTPFKHIYLTTRKPAKLVISKDST